MSRTAWSRASNVPSERIPPSNAPNSSRSKGKAKANDPPKSKEVLRLERLVAGVKGSTSKDPKGGCYCQARVHLLSKYTPICLQCGLVICSLHFPYYHCPHCDSPLLTPSSRNSLAEKLTVEISEVVAREHEQRELEQQERHKAVGAFPTLSTSTGNSRDAVSSQPRKVLSLNAQTRKVTVASYLPASASHASSKIEELEPEEKRVPPPPKGVDFVRGKAAEGARWENMRCERIHYIPPPSQNTAEGSSRGRRRKKGAERNPS